MSRSYLFAKFLPSYVQAVDCFGIYFSILCINFGRYGSDHIVINRIKSNVFFNSPNMYSSQDAIGAKALCVCYVASRNFHRSPVEVDLAAL